MELRQYIVRSFIFFIVFLLGLTLYYFVSGYVYITSKKKEINQNWAKSKCDPRVIPFAGWLVGPPDVSGLSNGIECFLMMFKNVFMKFMSPFIEFFEKIVEVLHDLVVNMYHVRQMFHYLRQSIHDALYDTASLIYGYGKKLAYLFNRLVKTFVLIFKVFEDVFDFMMYGIYTLASLWNGPIGGVARFFCFEPSTKIPLLHTTKCIKDITLQDTLLKGGKVLGICKFIGTNIPLVQYKEDKVSKEHLIQQNHTFLRMKHLCLPQVSSSPILYCLITERGIIGTQHAIYADYTELPTEQDTKEFQRKQLHGLCKTPLQSVPMGKKVCGFHSCANVLTKEGYVPLSHVSLNTSLVDNKVLGMFHVFLDTVYEYKGIKMGADTLIYEDTWKWVQESPHAKKRKGTMEGIHLITEKGVFMVEDTLVKDFYEEREELEEFTQSCMQKIET